MKQVKALNIIRSCMFVPGNQLRMLQKSLTIPANIIIPDMEDSVPESEKLGALDTIKAFLPNFTNHRVYPRVNSVESNLIIRDLNGILDENTIAHIEGIVVPKLQSLEQYSFIEEYLKSFEHRHERKENSIKLIPWFESPYAILNMAKVLEKSNRIVAASIGGEDYLWEMGLERSDSLKELEHARVLFCMNCLAYGVVPLDTPNVDYTEPDKLEQEIKYLRKLGFKGKNAIHPTQVPIINRGFGLRKDEIEHAQQVVEAFEKAEREGKAALNFQGKMIDVPVYKKALSVLKEAKFEQ